MSGDDGYGDMNRPVVKICGITGREDAFYSISAGARILGFIFFEKSPRYISPSHAAAIVSSCRKRFGDDAGYAGVFVNAAIETITDAVSTAGIDYIQLHGDEDNAFIDGLRKTLYSAGLDKCRIIQAFRIRDGADVVRARSSMADYVLFDSFTSGEYGGTGQGFDWSLIREFGQDHRLFLSGGINAGNVIEAVRSIHPHGIDLSSSVEREKGVKDKKKIDEFFAVFHSEAL
ncbi:MAG: hypothetical protein CVV44_13175 [Spirochaetae bacterium HGW-Spirochaetae-1]|jgi:phosphoribosylanthranilate isomerase|nr:MAG: hypothetical protein CVV44_13175 [Spirochaetae bacterium HGW-Spirochaetae-1]